MVLHSFSNVVKVVRAQQVFGIPIERIRFHADGVFFGQALVTLDTIPPGSALNEQEKRVSWFSTSGRVVIGRAAAGLASLRPSRGAVAFAIRRVSRNSDQPSTALYFFQLGPPDIVHAGLSEKLTFSENKDLLL
jgi:hypothetical protein